MKKLYIITTVLMIFFSLSFCASSLYVKDGAVTYEEVQTGADGIPETPEEITLAKTENLTVLKSAIGAVTLSWNKTEGAYAYQIYIKSAGDKNFRYAYTTRLQEVTIDEIEEMANIDLFYSLPDEIENKIEGDDNILDWAL